MNSPVKLSNWESVYGKKNYRKNYRQSRANITGDSSENHKNIQLGGHAPKPSWEKKRKVLNS